MDNRLQQQAAAHTLNTTATRLNDENRAQDPAQTLEHIPTEADK